MAKLTLQQFDAEHVLLNATEHSTMTEALNEFKGWEKAGAVRYLLQGTMSAQCACKRILESRNRAITVQVLRPVRDEAGVVLQGEGSMAEAALTLKAPQAVAVLEALHKPEEMVFVDVTEATFAVS